MRTNYATALRASGRFADSLRELRAAAALDDALARDPHLAFAPPLEAGDDGSSSKDATAPPEWRVAAVAEEGALPERTPKEMREALRQVCITRVLEADECKWAIETAEAHVAANGGWDGEGHHDAHKTKDLVVAESVELELGQVQANFAHLAGDEPTVWRADGRVVAGGLFCRQV